jgi:putative hydrolase of HD superfamily
MPGTLSASLPKRKSIPCPLSKGTVAVKIVEAMFEWNLLTTMLDGASMQRWNDKIRPVELRELDKQAHKMLIAYVLGKFEEQDDAFSWVEIIEGGLFEFLERLVITDLKPQIFDRIRQDRERYGRLKEWTFKRLEPMLASMGEGVPHRFRAYFDDDRETLGRRILRAAHLYATRWEFDLIEHFNPGGREMLEIRATLQERQERYSDLRGIQALAVYQNYRHFVDLCGQLRFQLRWAHINMVPRISVLGHMLMVAILSYLLSVEMKACRRRAVNNYFTGLFHDLPEVLTRDIISPVKRSVEGLDEVIKTYEKEQMEKEVYRLIPAAWKDEIAMYVEDEFTSIVTIDGAPVPATSDEISRRFNEDRFSPRDGELIKAMDDLVALAEATAAMGNGIAARALREAESGIRNRYRDLETCGIDIGRLFREAPTPALRP